MIEARGNLWDDWSPAWRVITTNGYVNRFGECVMGRGVAAQAKKRYPDLPKRLGVRIEESGNRVYLFPDIMIASFPVKTLWFRIASADLIRRSCRQLTARLDALGGDQTAVMPRPGCGNGKLDWEADVKPICEELLDDRVIVLEYSGWGGRR